MGRLIDSELAFSNKLKQYDVDQTGVFNTAVKEGTASLKGLYANAIAATGDVTGNESMRQYGLDKAKKFEQDVSLYAKKDIPRSLEDINSVGSAIDWTQYQLGNLTPSIIESIGSGIIGAGIGAAAGSTVPVAGTAAGGAGGFVAGLTGKTFVKGYLEKQVAKMVAKGVAEDVAKSTVTKEVAKKAGAAAVMFGNSYVQGVGDVYGETMDEKGKGNAMAAFLGAVPYAAMDTIVDMSVLGKVLKGSEGEAALKRYSKSILSSSLAEGAQESAQEADLMAVGIASGKTYDTDTVISRLGNSFAAAALGGAMGGAVGGRKSSTSVSSTPQIDATNTLQSDTSPTVKPEETFTKVVQALPEKDRDVLSHAVSRTIDVSKVESLTPQERQIMGIALNAAMEISGVDTSVIQQNIATIESTGVKIPTAPTKQEVATPENKTIAKTSVKPVVDKVPAVVKENKKPVDVRIIPENISNSEHAGNVYSELDTAKAGERLYAPSDSSTKTGTDAASFQGIPSSFPKWVPSDLRKTPLFKQVKEAMLNNKYPKSKPAQRLYDVVHKEIVRRNEEEPTMANTKRPSASGVVKNQYGGMLHPEDTKELESFIDAVRTGDKKTPIDANIDPILAKLGINTEQSLETLAKKAEDILHGKIDAKPLYRLGREFKNAKFTLDSISTENIDELLSEFQAHKLVQQTLNETNPNIRAVLQIQIFRAIADKMGSNLDTLGQYISKKNLINLSRKSNPKEFLGTIKHEIRHHAYKMMPKEEKTFIKEWYKGLSDDQLIEIYGSEDRLNDYKDRYKGNIDMMVDETANQSFDSKKTFEGGKIFQAYRKAIEKIALIFDTIFKRTTTRRVHNLYNDVFKQIGGDKFKYSKGFMAEMRKSGMNLGEVTSRDYIKNAPSGMANVKKTVSDKGNLQAREVFNSAWKKIYGEDAPKRLTDLLITPKTVQMIRESNKISFEAGKDVQRNKEEDKKEFRMAATEYVKEFIPKEYQGNLISRIVNVSNSSNLDLLMKNVESQLLKIEGDNVKKLEKRLKLEFKIKERFDKMKAKTREEKQAIRDKNAVKIKEIRAYLIKMFKEKTAKTKEIKSKIVEYVNENIPATQRGKFLTSVKNAKTESDLKKVIAYVDDVRGKYERSILVKSIESISDNISKLPVDIQRTIIEITSKIELKGHTAKTIERLQKTRAYLDTQATDHSMPRRVLNELGILTRTPLNEISTQKLIEINNRLSIYTTVGKNIMKDKVVIEKRTLDEKLADIEKGSINLDKLNPDDRLNTFVKDHLDDPSYKKSFKEKTQEFFSFDADKFQRLRLALMGTDRLFNLIDGRANYQGINYKTFKVPFDKAHNQWQYAEDRIKRSFYNTLNTLKLTEENSKRIAIYAYMQQRGGVKKLIEDHKYTQEQLDAIKLTEKEMSMYKFMRQHLDDLHEILREKMARENNVDLGKPENYFPMMTNYGVTKPLLEELEQMGRMKSVAFGSVKERQENAHQVLKLDAFTVFDSYVGKSTYFIATDSIVRNLNKIASSEKYRNAVGENAQRAVLTWLDVLARKGGAVKKESKWEEKMNEFNNNLSIMVLGLRLTTIIKQPLALLDGAAEIGAYAFKGTRSIINEDWRGFIEKNSSEMRNRAGGDPAFMEVTHNKFLPTMQDKAMAPIKFLDQYTAGSVWIGAYMKNMDEQGKSIDLENPNNEAIEYANLVVRKTQASGSFKDLPLAMVNEYRTASKLLFKFQTFVLNRWSYLSEDLPDKIKNNKALAVQQITFLSLSMIAESSVNSIYKNIMGTDTGDDEDNMFVREIKNILSSSIQTVPFLGQLISSTTYGSNPIPLVEVGNKLFDSLKQIKDAKKMSTKEKHILRSMSYVIGSYYGLPTEQARQIVEGIFFGKSESYSSKL